MRTLPISVNLQHRNVVFAGGGVESSAKVRLVCASDAHITVIAAKLNADLQHHWRHGKIRWIKLQASPDNIADFLQDCMIFYAATGDKTLDAALVAAAKPHAALTNAVDQPLLGNFITPAFINHHPLTIAISTQGTSPVLARFLKKNIESMLPQHIGRLAQFAGNIRGFIEHRLKFQHRRKFWEWFFSHHFYDGMPPVLQPPEQLVQNFENSAQSSPPPALNVLPLENIADDNALQHLRHADAVYYHHKNSCREWLEMARREANFFPNMLPDKNQLQQAKQFGQRLMVIARRQDLPTLILRAEDAAMPLHYLGKMPDFSIIIKTKNDLQLVNWRHLQRGEIFLPRKFFTDLQSILLNSGHSAHMPIYCFGDNRQLKSVPLGQLSQMPHNRAHIIFQMSAKIHHMPASDSANTKGEKKYAQNL